MIRNASADVAELPSCEDREVPLERPVAIHSAISATTDFPEFAVALERYPRTPMMPEVRRLSKISNWRSAAYIALQWGIISLAIYLAVQSGHWAAYVAAALVIATRQQALGVLLHDGAHWLLFTNRTINDVVSDLLVAFPIGMSTTLYRDTHFRHHRFANTADDPDMEYQSKDHDWWDWPKTRTGLVWVLFKSFTGLNAYSAARPYMMWSPGYNLFKPLSPAYPLRARILWVVSTIAVYIAVIGTGILIPVLLMFALPAMTVLNLVNRLRATAEHVETEGTHELNSTRTVIPRWWERLVIAPMNVSYHLEHHLFPSVPGPNLAQLHDILMQDETYRERAHCTHSYVGVLNEFMHTHR